jgi:hypothetical protein
MTLREGKDTGNLKKKHKIALFGKVAWEEAMDLTCRKTP